MFRCIKEFGEIVENAFRIHEGREEQFEKWEAELGKVDPAHCDACKQYAESVKE